MEQKQQVSLQDLLNEKKSLTVESTSKTSSESLESTNLVEVDPSQIAPMRPTIEQEQVPETLCVGRATESQSRQGRKEKIRSGASGGTDEPDAP